MVSVEIFGNPQINFFHRSQYYKLKLYVAKSLILSCRIISKVIEMVKKIKCRNCGDIFKKPIFGLKPLEYKAGLKMKGGIVDLGAIIVCPKCGFEGPLKEFEPVEGE